MNELDASSVIIILSVCVTPPIITDNSSSTFAPTLKPCVIPAGFTSLSLNPKRYNLFVLPTLLVFAMSIEIQSIVSRGAVIALGVMMLVIYALSSFTNASFLNPSDTSANCPKLELELVIEASPPFIAAKCLLYPIANTDTICIIASFVIVI